MQDPSAESRFLDWSSLAPQNEPNFSSNQFEAERTNIQNQFANLRTQEQMQLFSTARSLGLSGVYLTDISALAKITPAELENIPNLKDARGSIVKKIHDAVQQRSNNILSNNNLILFRGFLTQVAEQRGCSVIELDVVDLQSKSIPLWGNTDIFQHSFARLFVAYRDLQYSNFARRGAQSGREENTGALTDDEFIEKYGIAPWKFVNETLERAGLDFEVDHPNEFDHVAYSPKLRKRSNKQEIMFGSLSSGEKILMALTLTVYYAADRRQITRFPKILLLDEIDAPLHPSMSKLLIDTVVGTFVGQHGIKVIATTHSPSTVALAPESSLYVMRPGVPGLEKTSKSRALNILTVGVPTLAISYDGRRQVFVESPIDVMLLDKVYQLLKPKLNSERSLDFLQTGTKRKDNSSDINTGCDIVGGLVKNLRASGNSSVFGIIDWDGKNTSGGGVLVLAEGRRDGLENILFDPLLLVSLIARDVRECANDIGLLEGERFALISGLPLARLQELMDRVVSLVLPAGPQGEVAHVEYVGGLKMRVRQDYLFLDDHVLEQRIVAAFPAFGKLSRSRSGGLAAHIVDYVLAEKPEYIPTELSSVFEEILFTESHLS